MTELMLSLDTEEACNAVPEFIEAGVRHFKVDPWVMMPWQHRTYYRIHDPMISAGGEVMFDLKLYNTMDSVYRIAQAAWYAGATMLTVYANETMIDAAMRARTTPPRQKVLAVGRLTDTLDHAMVPSILVQRCDGVICSVADAASRLRFHGEKVYASPGIRPTGYKMHNHQGQSATPQEAAAAGVDFAIMGRPIYESDNPLQTARYVLELLRKGTEQHRIEVAAARRGIHLVQPADARTE